MTRRRCVQKGAKLEMPQWDYTSPDYITLLVTDIGVFTPSAVSDELIKMYQ
jgi:translation initiation factor eIF-2B subunit alpha